VMSLVTYTFQLCQIYHQAKEYFLGLINVPHGSGHVQRLYFKSCVTLLWMSCEQPRPIEINAYTCLGCSQLIHRRVAHNWKYSLRTLNYQSCPKSGSVSSLWHTVIYLWFCIQIAYSVFIVIGKLRKCLKNQKLVEVCSNKTGNQC